MGGMQKHSFYLARYLKQEGAEITLAHCVYNQKQLPGDEEIEEKLGLNPNQVNSFHFPESINIPGHYIFNSKKYSKLLFNHFKNTLETYDLIYAQGFTAWHFLKKTSKGKRPPVIVNLHGVEMYQQAFSKREKAEKKLLRIPADYLIKKADYLQSLGGKLTPLLSSLSGNNNIWECGIGIEKTWIKNEANAVNNPVRFVFVGRHEIRKGIYLLNEVLENLVKIHSGFQVDFIGPIPDNKKLSGKQFVYHGKLKEETEIKGVLDQCDVLLLPSLSEGMPTVILEAMSRGLAILATDVGAVQNMVDESNGWLIKPGDVNELKSAIQAVLDTKVETISEKKSNSLQKITAFDWQKVTRHHLTFFQKITNL